MSQLSWQSSDLTSEDVEARLAVASDTELARVTRLSLSHNRLTSVPAGVGRLRNLRELLLDGNTKLWSFDGDVAVALTKLHTLWLGGCELLPRALQVTISDDRTLTQQALGQLAAHAARQRLRLERDTAERERAQAEAQRLATEEQKRDNLVAVLREKIEDLQNLVRAKNQTIRERDRTIGELTDELEQARTAAQVLRQCIRDEMLRSQRAFATLLDM